MSKRHSSLHGKLNFLFSPNFNSFNSLKTEIGHEHVLKLRTWLEVVSYESLSFLNMIVVFPVFFLRMDLNPSSVVQRVQPAEVFESTVELRNNSLAFKGSPSIKVNI